MKEAMWSVDQVTGSSFSDAAPDGFQFTLFGFEPLWDDLCQHFGGSTTTMADIETYVIERTRYLSKHLREILRKYEDRREIEVLSVEGMKRRKGTFPADKVLIKFL